MRLIIIKSAPLEVAVLNIDKRNHHNNKELLALRRFLPLLAVLAMSALVHAQNIEAMKLLTPQIGWALSGNRLYWTTDNGAHWGDISPRPEDITDAFFLDTSRGWALLSSLVTDSSLISFSLAGTNDAGKSWSISRLRVASQKPEELDGSGWLDFIDPMHGWVVLPARSSSALSWGLLLTTDDGGKSWKELPQVPIAGRPIFITAQNGWLSGNGGPGGVYTTKDGGRTWDDNEPPLEELPTSLPTRPWYGDVWFTDSKHGFIPVRLSSATDAENARGSALVLYVTDNAGLTWTRNATLTDKSFAKTGAPLEHFGPSAFALDQSGAAV
jgi:photosystem II stability/assembly factor-like uncharacterized protein